MAPVVYLRVEPYDPDAVDGDGDGIVQERTAWERPLGTRIFDELGREIVRGATSGTAMPGSRVVDRNGNPIEYTPTFARGAGAKPRSVLGPTLGESRAGRTLGSSGASLGQRVGGLNQNMVPEPPPAPAPDPTPAAPAPAGPPGSPEAIRARNAEVISQIEALGGFFDFSSLPHEERDAFIEREKRKTVTPSIGANREGGRESIRNRWNWLIDDKKDAVTHLEELISQTTNPDDEKRLRQKLALAKQVVEYLEAKNPDEVVDEIVSLVRQMLDDEDTRLAVQMPISKFPDFLAEGYKTTHEAHSEHSGPDIRTAYEVTQGIPADAPASVRPASAYLQNGARRRAARQVAIDEGAVDPDATTSFTKHNAGSAGLYGGVQMIMKPDVGGRTRFGMGDSYNASIRSAPLVGATDDQLVDAVLATDGGKGAFLDSEKKRFSDLVEILATGGKPELLGASPIDDSVSEKFGIPGQRGSVEYFESLIFGSFDINDIEEIYLPESLVPRTSKPKGNFGRDTRDWLAESLKNNPELFQFLSMEQIQELRRLIELHPEETERMVGKLTLVLNFIDELKDQQNFLQQIANASPDLKVTFTTPKGQSGLAHSRFGLPEDADRMAFLEERIESNVRTIFEQLQQLPTGPEAEENRRRDFDLGDTDADDYMSGKPADIQEKVARIKLKLEPYDPDAQDGDGDGIVQEGTAWERPVGIRLLDADGLDIEIGIISAQTISGLQYVDRDGNKVDYTPKYMSGEQADVSKPALGAIPTLGQRARGENPNEPKLPKPQRRPKVPQGQEEIEELREDVEYDEGMQEIASRLGTPDDPVDWEDPYEVVSAERLGYEGTEGQTDDEGFPLETRDAWLSAYLDDRFAADWAQWDSCRNIRKMAYLLAGIIPGAGDPNLWRSQGYFGNGWGSTDGFGDENPDVRMEQALFIMALLRQFRQSYDEESYAYQVTRRFYRAMDTDDIDGFLKEMQEGAIVDIPIISASTRDRIGDKHILSRRDAENGRGYGDTILIEFEGEGVDFLASGELTYTYTEQDELRDLMAIAEGLREEIAYREGDEDDEDFDPEQWDEIFEAIDFLEQNYRDPDKYADRERARQIVRAHVADYDTFGGRPYREAGVVIDEGKDSDAFWDAVEGTQDGKVKEVITGGRFEVVSVEEDETGSPYEYRVKLRQISVFDPMNPGMTTGEETPEAPKASEEELVVTAKQMGANLPGDPDADLPGEMFDEPDQDVVNALEESYDQLAVRSVAYAFITGDFSWILEDLARGTSLYGKDDGVDASLADIRQFMENVRQEAHRTAVREDTWDGEYLYVWRGGSVAGDEPVSVTAASREVAEGYGEAFYYRIPLQGIIYREDRNGEAGEYVVDPGMLELVEEPERKESPVRDFITRLEREGTSGAFRTNVEAIEALYERYENGEIDDAQLQELSFEVDEAARRELFDELAMLTDRETAELLSAWIDGQFDVTYSMREDVVSGRSEEILELIDESDVSPDPLFRGMALSDDELDEMVRTGRVVLPLGATSRSSSSASEYGPALFRIEGAKAFPAYLFSRVDEKEYLVSGEFEIVEIGKLADRDGNPTEKTVFVLRPTGRDFLRHREEILSNSPMPTEEGEPSTTPKSIRTAPEPELPDWVTDFYDEDDIPEEFLGVDEDGFVIISKDSDWLPDERDSVVWHGTPTRITDDYVSTAASVGSMHRYDDLFAGTENDYENHGLVDMDGEPLPHWDRVWAGTPRIASEYAGLVGADWGDAYMYGLEVTGGMQQTMDGYALEEDGHQIVRKFRFVDPEVLDEMRRDNPGILFNRHRGDGEERTGPANIQTRTYGNENQFVEVTGFELHGREYTVERGGDARGRQYNGYLVAYDSNGHKAGYIDYQLDPDDPNTVHIAMIEVEPHMRREGIGSALVQALGAENEGREIEWGMVTPEGNALRESLIADYPRLAGKRGRDLPDSIDDLVYETYDGDPQRLIDEYEIQIPDGFTSPDGPVGRLPDGRYVSFTQNRDGTYDIEVHNNFYDIVDKFDLDDLEADIAEEQWREASGSFLYHGTDPSNLDSIGRIGLRPENLTRGIGNRGVGPSVFTSLSYGVASTHYGDVIEIDVPRMVADGYLSREDVMREPGFDRDDAIASLAREFGEEWYGDAGLGGEAPDTFIFSKPIPAKYLSLNGTPLEERSSNGLIKEGEDGGYTVTYMGEEVDLDIDFDVEIDDNLGSDIEAAGYQGATRDWLSWKGQAAIRAVMSRIMGLPYLRGAGSLEWEDDLGIDFPEELYNGNVDNPNVSYRLKNYVAKAYGMLRMAAQGKRNSRELYRGIVVKDRSPILNLREGDEFDIPPSSFGYDMETAQRFIKGGLFEPSDTMIDMDEDLFPYETKSVIFRLAPGSKGTQGIDDDEMESEVFEQITGGNFRVVGVKDVDPLDDRRFDLEERLDAGEITEEEYEEQLKEINNSPDESYKEIIIEQVAYFDPDRGRMVRHDEEEDEDEFPSSREAPEAPQSDDEDIDPIADVTDTEVVEEAEDERPRGLKGRVVPKMAAFREKTSILRRIRSRNVPNQNNGAWRNPRSALEDEDLIVKDGTVPMPKDGLNANQEVRQQYAHGVMDLRLTEDGEEALDAIIEAGTEALKLVNNDPELTKLDKEVEDALNEIYESDRRKERALEVLNLAAGYYENLWKTLDSNNDVFNSLIDTKFFQNLFDKLGEFSHDRLEFEIQQLLLFIDPMTRDEASNPESGDFQFTRRQLDKYLTAMLEEQVTKPRFVRRLADMFEGTPVPYASKYALEESLKAEGIELTGEMTAELYDLNDYKQLINYVAELNDGKLPTSNIRNFYESMLRERYRKFMKELQENKANPKFSRQRDGFEQATAEAQEAHEKWLDARNKRATYRLQVIREVLQQNRPSIGKGDTKKIFGRIIPRKKSQRHEAVSAKEINEEIDFINGFIPAEWLENMSTDHVVGWGARGHYHFRTKRIQLSGGRYDRVGVLAHEITHGVQHANVQVSAAERLFLSRRAQTHPDSDWVPRRYMEDKPPWFEMGLGIDYATKIYEDSITEISTIGMDTIFRGDRFRSDDLTAFWLGVLLTL